MKSDIDRLMTERNLDAIVIEGPDGLTSHNAPWNYMVRGQHLTGVVVKRRNEPAKLIYGSMEKLQAEATGLELVPSNRWNWPDIIKKFPDDLLTASAELWRQRFADLGIRGRVGWYGTVEAGVFLARVQKLRQAAPDVEIIGEFDRSAIDEARKTKDADEIAMMADVGRRAGEIVREVIRFIGSHRGADGVLVDKSNKPLTIGDVKALIRRELDARDLDHPDPVIFAQGRDAGIPHATGDEPAPIRLGESIVFDFFPRDRKTGYYHDMTRTFSIGSAPADLQKVYDDVRYVFDAVMRSLKAGERSKKYQDLTCEQFAARGHKTIDQHWPLDEGYCHSLGHGIGLEVHEPLAFSSFVDRGDTLEPGSVFTIEPGLYYPDRKIGVRIEDTVACMPDGSFRSLTDAPRDLVIRLPA
jgi:Xaa-Pro aminopeptidase